MGVITRRAVDYAEKSWYEVMDQSREHVEEGMTENKEPVTITQGLSRARAEPE